jgi:hypothetical protein
MEIRTVTLSGAVSVLLPADVIFELPEEFIAKVDWDTRVARRLD